MTALHLESSVHPAQPIIVADLDDAADADDPFHLDIRIIENTPETETVLMCGTGDNCGSSCPSACTGSTV